MNPSSSGVSASVAETSPQLRLYFLTLFPEVIESVLSSSLLGKAQKKGLVSYHPIQLRDFATDRHRTVDDTPYGGGEGMILKVDILYKAWQKAQELARANRPDAQPLTLLMSPQGPKFDQEMAKGWSGVRDLILVSGHYEGVDERFIDLCVDGEVSIGDYVLTGGELPSLVIADAVVRLIPGVVGNRQSVELDSLENDLLKYPQYTRPREFEGLEVPEVLLGGDHGSIADWRRHQMEERTARKRPDLWQSHLSKNPKPR